MAETFTTRQEEGMRGSARSEAMKARWADPEYRRSGGGMTGKHHSPETCAKLRIASTGRPCTKRMMEMFKKPKTEEHKRKISESHKGMAYSYETKMKVSVSKKGKKLSEETRKRMSASHIGLVDGENNPMYGKHPSPETLKKLSESHKGKNAGEKHCFWKGGKVPLLSLIRRCVEYRQWRTAVFERDDYTCGFCGKRGGYVEADHFPVEFKKIFDRNEIISLDQAVMCGEFWDINNGRTLCRKCHDTTKPGRIK